MTLAETWRAMLRADQEFLRRRTLADQEKAAAARREWERRLAGVTARENLAA